MLCTQYEVMEAASGEWAECVPGYGGAPLVHNSTTLYWAKGAPCLTIRAVIWVLLGLGIAVFVLCFCVLPCAYVARTTGSNTCIRAQRLVKFFRVSAGARRTS